MSDEPESPLPDDSETAKTLVAYGRLRGPMFDAIMERVADLAIPFRKLSEQQQHDFMRSIRSRIDAHLERAVKVIIAADQPTITAKLGDFTVKSDAITGKFEASRVQDYLTNLGAHGSRPIQIVLADPKLFDNGTYEEKTKAAPDQTDLPLVPPNDEDLADAGDDDEAAVDSGPSEEEE